MRGIYTRNVVNMENIRKKPTHNNTIKNNNIRNNSIRNRNRNKIVDNSPIKIKLDVLICTPDENTDRFKKCLSTFKETTKGIDYNLIIRNNHWFKDFKNTVEFNKALDECNDWLLVLDDDVYFENNNWLQTMINATTIDNVHVIGTNIWYSDKIESGSGAVIDYDCNTKFIKGDNNIRKVSSIGTCTALIKKTSLRFDTNYTHYFIDPDYCLRGWEKGLKTVVVPVRTFHRCDGFVMNQNQKQVSDLLQIGKDEFKKIWVDTNRLETLYKKIKFDVGHELPFLTQIDEKDYKYSVNFVIMNGYGGAIGELLDSLIRNAPDNIKITKSTDPVDEDNTINYYIVWHLFKKDNRIRKCNKAIDVLFSPHPDDKSFLPTIKEADHNVFMCSKYQKEAIQYGISSDKTSLIFVGIDDMYFDDRLRVFCPAWLHDRGARKGSYIWDIISKLDWLNCYSSEGKLNKDELLLQYQACDVVLSTGLIEGGPMMILESLALGKTIITPDGVGMADDFKKDLITYNPKDIQSLIRILKNIYNEKMRKTIKYKQFTQLNYVKQHYELFDRLITEKYCKKGEN